MRCTRSRVTIVGRRAVGGAWRVRCRRHACLAGRGHSVPDRRVDRAREGCRADSLAARPGRRANASVPDAGVFPGCALQRVSNAMLPRPISMTRPLTRIARSASTSRPSRHGPADRLALVDRQALRQRRAGREQPAAEVRARRSGARILDHRSRASGRRSAPARGRPSRAKTYAIARVPLLACVAHALRHPARRAHGVERRERDHQLLDPVSTHSGVRRRCRAAVETQHRGELRRVAAGARDAGRVRRQRPAIAARVRPG